METTKEYKPVIVGVSATSLVQGEIDLLTKTTPYGVILMPHNIMTPDESVSLSQGLFEQKRVNIVDRIKNLTTQVKKCGVVNIFVDQEGGRVCRIEDIFFSKGLCRSGVDFEQYPEYKENYGPGGKWEHRFMPAKYFGDMYKKETPEKARSAVYSNYYKITKGLLELGINGNFAPVCDLYHEGITTNAIGDRSFSDNKQIVVELGIASLQAIKDAKGISCVKHMPGHGCTSTDSHTGLPIVTKSLKDLEKTDFWVFKELAPYAEFAMTAHILYTCLDAVNPATLSRIVINYIREQIGFKGSIITDALNMDALYKITRNLGMKEDPTTNIKSRNRAEIIKIAKLARNAGCDYPLDVTSNLLEAKD